MKVLKLSFIGFAVFCLLPRVGVAQNAREISDKAMEIIEVGNMQMEATLKIIDAKGRERIREIKTQTKAFDATTKTLLRFTSPADVKGTSLLIYDYDNKPDDMWIYLPALRRNRRIVSDEKGKSFMGSEFSNADMSIPNPDDFVYRVLGEEVFNNAKCWKIESKCKNEDIEDENGYLRRVSWIDKESFLCYQVNFYDLEDELFKVQIISDYRAQTTGKQFAFHMEMENVRNGRKSVMQVDSFDQNVYLDEQAFSPAMLDK
jgi:hypothetical protein